MRHPAHPALLSAFIVLASALPGAIVAATPPALAGPWEALLGEWIADESGPASGKGSFSFARELQEQVIVRHNRLEMPAAAGRPAAVHEDLLVVFQAPGSGAARASYFDNEGHVIQYTTEWSAGGDTLILLSEPTPGAPRFRLTYRPTPDRLAIDFEIAPPGQSAFVPYLSGSAHRAPGRR